MHSIECSVVTGVGTLGQLDEKYSKILFCSKFISLAKVGHRDCMGYGSKNAKELSITIHSRDLSQDLCEQFLLASGLWF